MQENLLDQYILKIDELQKDQGSIAITINDEICYFVADLGSGLCFIRKTVYDENYRNDKAYAFDNHTMLDIENNCFIVPHYDSRTEDIYQQLITNPIDKSIIIFF